MSVDAVSESARTLAMVVEYDGSNYHGFQRQHGVTSIAERIESCLATLFGHEVKLVAAGRTDAGVHATGQVISCITTSCMPLRRIAVAANAIMRSDAIAILRVVERPAGFSARKHALSRTYRYRILNRIAPSPLFARRAFHVTSQLDLDAMRLAIEAFVGTHDFSALCLLPPRGSTVRTVTDASIVRRDDFVDICMAADSFLHHMVRISVGTLVEVGRGKRPWSGVADVIRSKRREHAGFTAPAHGLYLEKVDYDDPV